MRRLVHRGVLIPKAYEPKGFHINVKEQKVALTPKQEEMAVAWVKKLETEYVKDPVFVRNFFKDFCNALGLKKDLGSDDFDFSEIIRFVADEKSSKLSMSKEEKKRLAAERKVLREANKAKYGYAEVDGVKVELGNYLVEPPSIFMGRGKHPLRGRWKEGATENDVILNLSPDAPTPEGKWKGRVWQPDSMWVAKWDDKLRGDEKYIWLSDSSTPKQEREIEKFDKAVELEKMMNKIRTHIESNLECGDPKRRTVATVCYLIDALKFRVGDEKDKDETDTVGATTLRPEHIKIKANGLVTFDFLGKDSVRFYKEIVLPEPVVRNILELKKSARSHLFKGVRSDNVGEFLSEVTPGLTAKVFRTYHATKVVREYLEKAKVTKNDPVYLKKHVATMANLEAAKICNHKRKLPKKWHESLAKKMERLKKLRSMKTKKSKERVKDLHVKIDTIKATRDYNLSTSLKSYIDPRVYSEWFSKVDFDWKLFYSKTLQRKFSWVDWNT
jgi:DNA topoisomerase-1